MEYKKITFREINDLLKSRFGLSIPTKKSLVPETLFSIAKKEDIDIKNFYLSSSEEWSWGNKSFTAEEFKESLFRDMQIDDEMEMIIVLDSCFLNDTFYSIKYRDFIDFIDYHNREIPFSDFMEPFDHIFIFPELKFIVILHHEGKIMVLNF